jgi:hypothetical protein
LEIARSQQCDQAGRHGEAVDWLVAGVRKNDVEAITRLGKRLLIGDHAPYLPREAVRFLTDARDRGGGEAAAILAVCAATGADGAQPNMPLAWRNLVLSAERGWKPAQDQLRVLGGVDPATWWSSPSPNRTCTTTPGLRLMPYHGSNPPAAADVHTNPLIRSHLRFIEPQMAQWVIEKARSRLTRAMVYDAASRETTTHATRTNTSTSFDLLETDLVCVLLQWRMAACLGLPFRHFEALTVLHYDVGEEVSEHFDFVDPKVPNYEQHLRARGQRVVTFLVYLNDDYDGGATEFPRLGVSHKGQAGEGFFFVNAFADGRPDVRTLHAGRAPTRGEKWIVSQFVKNQPAF